MRIPARRGMALATLALAASVAVAPLAGASSRPPIVRLAGDNTFSFTGASGQRVLITQKVTFSNLTKDNPDLQIDGVGSIGAFLLVRDGDISAQDSLTVIALPKSAGGGFDLTAPAVPATQVTGRDCLLGVDTELTCSPTYKDPHLAVLDRGYYRVVGIGAHGPFTVHLVLHGLDGTLEMTPAQAVTGSVKPFATPMPSTPVSVAASGGAFGSLASRGLVYSIMTFDRGPGAMPSYGACDYDGLQTAAQPIAFLPPCPGGSNVLPPVVVGADIDSQREVMSQTEITTGPVDLTGRGFYYTHTGPVTYVDGYDIFLPFPR